MDDERYNAERARIVQAQVAIRKHRQAKAFAKVEPGDYKAMRNLKLATSVSHDALAKSL